MAIQFAEPSQRLGNDEEKDRQVVREFYRSVAHDLWHLQTAAAAGRWATVSAFAQRIQVSCLQVRERKAAEAAAVLSRYPSEFFAGAHANCGWDIAELMDRAETFGRRHA